MGGKQEKFADKGFLAVLIKTRVTKLVIVKGLENAVCRNGTGFSM